VWTITSADYLVWEGHATSIEDALEAYRQALGAGAAEFDQANPDWMLELFVWEEERN
jgi:hypothetical protein